MYDELAKYYDAIYASKDYRAESRTVRDVLRRYGPPGARTLLDVGCGTGGHLVPLAEWFDVRGVDASAAMLRIARRKLPHVPFSRGRMESFHLRQRFDAITCLFSAIGYVRTLPALEATMHNFAHHLRPGGVVVIEPWIPPEQWISGHAGLVTHDAPALKIARMNVTTRRGRRSILDFHYLIATPGDPVRHYQDRQVLGLFTVPETLERMRRAGLRARHLSRGLGHGHRRGLYVGVRIRAPSDRDD